MPCSHKLPVVDISNFEDRKTEVVQQLMEVRTTRPRPTTDLWSLTPVAQAARTGFFYVTGHGLDQVTPSSCRVCFS